VSPGRRASGIGTGPKLAVALVLLVSALSGWAQTMYKWVDEKGVTHFSEHPPPDAKTEKKATKVTPKVTPPSGGGAYDPNAWKSKEAEAKKRSVDRGQQEQAEARNAAKRAEQCDRARARVAFLKDVNVLFRTNPDGTRTCLRYERVEVPGFQQVRGVMRLRPLRGEPPGR
jgi:hypothetical protein